jgi:acetyl-CoA carboxylase carboxyl transferase subunit alpha
MKVTAQHLERIGVIDRIVQEPVGGAHRDPEAAAKALGTAIGEELDALALLDTDTLRRKREDRFLKIGAS